MEFLGKRPALRQGRDQRSRSSHSTGAVVPNATVTATSATQGTKLHANDIGQW